jgi:hypothetical protein
LVTDTQIAERFAICRVTVSRWRNRFAVERLGFQAGNARA